jgi:hypothetical protein
VSRGPDAGARLERALLASAGAGGCAVLIAEATWVRWASATFTGARHTLWFEGLADDALDRWLAGLPEAEITLREHVVADLAVTQMARADDMARFTIEALTLEA